MYKINWRNDEYFIPERMMPGITRYIEQGIRPGKFLTAVICNNLKEAVWQADDENIRNLPAYVTYFHNEAPSACWGSKEAMDQWIASFSVMPPLFADVCGIRASLDGMYKEAAAKA